MNSAAEVMRLMPTSNFCICLDRVILRETTSGWLEFGQSILSLTLFSDLIGNFFYFLVSEFCFVFFDIFTCGIPNRAVVFSVSLLENESW